MQQPVVPVYNGNTKWNWEMAFVLYCGGMTFDDILNHKSFRDMPKSTLEDRAKKYGWASRRQEVALMNKADMLKDKARRLQDKLEEEAIEHQMFVLSELRRERRVFEDRGKNVKDDDGKDEQLIRLNVLEKIDGMARKLTRLDEQKEVNPIAQGFAVLVNLQTTRGAQITQNGPLPLPSPSDDVTEHSKGILRSKNAYPEEVVDAEIINSEEAGTANGQPGPQEPEKRPMPSPGSLFGARPIDS